MNLVERAGRMVKHPRLTASGVGEHFYVIDLMRGLAAIAILVWHYQHFFFPQAETRLPVASRQIQPLYSALMPLYEYGSYAVQLFWMISVFVFCAVYAHTKATTRDFVVNRFARLYPLHIITLLLVAALQVMSAYRLGHWQIYANNDAYHFVLQIFFASNWGFQSGDSFNGPIWSISIEVIIYTVFWLTRGFLYRFGAAGPAIVALISFIVMKYPHTGPEHIWECSFFFFSGAAFFLVFQQIREFGWIMLLAGGLLIATSLSISHFELIRLARLNQPSLIAGMLLCGCALEALAFGNIAKRVRWIGDNTYGCYLWHVPIQIAAILGLDLIVGNRSAALHPIFLIAFIAIVMAVARLSFIYIEKPARRAIRSRFDPAAPREAIPAP